MNNQSVSDVAKPPANTTATPKRVEFTEGAQPVSSSNGQRYGALAQQEHEEDEDCFSTAQGRTGVRP